MDVPLPTFQVFGVRVACMAAPSYPISSASTRRPLAQLAMPPLALLIIPVPTLPLEVVLGIVALLAIGCRILGTHQVLKWPVYFLLCLLIAVDMLAYVVVRIAIGLLTPSEPSALENPATYSDWLAAAQRTDDSEGRTAWKLEDASDEYDWRHVKATTERLRAARLGNDYTALMSMLLPELTNNAHGELEWTLYCRTHVGTKRLLEQYRDEVCSSLHALAHAKPAAGTLAAQARREFSIAARASLGGCALVMSGGATFGIFHFGVVKALVELGMLPPVVCGASAGAGTCARARAALVAVAFSAHALPVCMHMPLIIVDVCVCVHVACVCVCVCSGGGVHVHSGRGGACTRAEPASRAERPIP